MASNIVLTFHRIPSQAWFEHMLNTVSRGGRHFVDAATLQGYLYAGQPLRSACHVTFDDGDRSFALHALPVLERRGIPASLFVAPDVLAGKIGYWFETMLHLSGYTAEVNFRALLAQQLGLSAAQLAAFSVPVQFKSLSLAEIWQVLTQLESATAAPPAPKTTLSLAEVQALDKHPLITIGAHSLTHPILANETAAEAERQISGSVANLADLLGRPVRHFAYPNGVAGLDFGPREQALLRAAGVEMAFTTHNGHLSQCNDPLALPRVGLGPGERREALRTTAKLLLAPWWDRLRSNEQTRQRHQLRSLRGR